MHAFRRRTRAVSTSVAQDLSWEPLEKWLECYEMQEQTWAAFDPSKAVGLEAGSEGGFASKVSSKLGERCLQNNKRLMINICRYLKTL